MAPKAGKATRPRVYARLRPMFGRDAGQPELFSIQQGTSLEYRKEESAELSRFTFDRVFGMNSTQAEVFESIGDVALNSLRQGFNSTILAYGQTGSGKTFSMEGAKDRDTGEYTSPGLIPRLFKEVFERFNTDSSIKNYEVSIQFIELYNEQLQDLLGKRKVVDVSMDPTGGYQCKDAVRHVCKDAKDAQHAYDMGCSMRATASTKMNEASSRSHALLQLSVAWTEQKGKSFAQLNLVDLAGSEGLKKTGAQGQNAKEGIKINLSLGKLALTVKCLAEGATHIPFRESKLTMMLAKGLGGNNMLHIILALSNSREQVNEGTACLRFGQSCLSMTVNPNANKLEKEQAEMRAVIKEQMQEISDLQSENEQLKEQLEQAEKRASIGAAEVPSFLIAKHIEINKEALSDDLKEAADEIEFLKQQLEDKQKQRQELEADKSAIEDISEAQLAGMSAQERAEFIEARRRARALERIKAVAENEQAQKAIEAEIAQQEEIEKKLSSKLEGADNARVVEEEHIRAEVEEAEAERRREIEERAAAMEAALQAAQRASDEREAERKRREAELEAELQKRETKLREEDQLRQQMQSATDEQNAELQQQMAQLHAEQEAQMKEIERAKAEQARVDQLQADAQAAIEAKRQQEAELDNIRQQLEMMAREADARAVAEHPKKLKEQLVCESSPYDSAELIISRTEARLARTAKRGKRADPEAVGRILETLPVLSACNDLRALTDLESANRSLFQEMGGVHRMIDYLRPRGQNAPYATIVARTLPCVLDASGRRHFFEYAMGTDGEGEVRLRYLLALLQSADPDDKENACVAIAAAAQDSPTNRQAFFEQGISTQVYGVLQDTSVQAMPRQRLQRVVVMAMGELAHDYDPFKDLLRVFEGVPLLLSFLSPSHDEYLIKETLQLLGHMTQNNTGIQQELQRYQAMQCYSQLLFAQMHDTQIAELAALALVNLISEVPACLATLEQHPRYDSIRFELLASMARALSSSMQRNKQMSSSLAGSDEFRFWGSATIAEWGDGTAGGDRKHTSFVDNPQFLLRAPQGANVCIVLQDTLEATREQDRVKQRPMFLRLCVTAASVETLATRLTQLDINSSGARPASVNDHTGVVMLEPNVQAALDVSKTREVALRCHVKTATPEDAWVVVPHVGCSHQHSRFVLTVFADREVSIETMLMPWHKRVLTSSWTNLCSAPRGIADARWRNCPQFQMINLGDKPTSVAAFLSYAERDLLRNKRHLTTTDPPSGLGAEERPLLSLYVMKSKVPERRYVGTLSPYVEEYVAHSVVTNAWCVSARWTLEPGDVYAVLAVMAEGTTHEVPLRLTLYSPPEEANAVMCKPLTAANEWHVIALEGTTDSQGLTQIELLPSAADDPIGASVQSALVMETDTPEAFCSIATELDHVPHKMLVKYQQQQAVLSVAFASGQTYTMTTRCINQRQEPVRNTALKLLLYSERSMQATAQPGTSLTPMATKAISTFVSKATADQIVYGEDGLPDDCKRQVTEADKEKELQNDPTVLHAVIDELEEQRDSLASFARAELKGQPDPQMEVLRSQNNELRDRLKALGQELKQAKAIGANNARRSDRDADLLGGSLGGGRLEPTALKQQLAEAQRANAQLQETVGMMSAGGDGATKALSQQLQETHKELASAKAAVARLEAVGGGGSGGGGSDGGGGGGGSSTDAELEKLRQQNRALKKQIDETPKSAACVLL